MYQSSKDHSSNPTQQRNSFYLPEFLYYSKIEFAKTEAVIAENYIASENAITNEISNLLKNAYKTNIAKINMDTDFRLAFTSAIREFMDMYADKYCGRRGERACC